MSAAKHLGPEDFFNYSRRMMSGKVYRKYQTAIHRVWDPLDFDYTIDQEDWKSLSEDDRRSLLGVTIRFLAGEQVVAEDVVPMLQAARALGRYDWVMFLTTFGMEEAKHADFLAHWHDLVVGILEPEEIAPYFLVRETTTDPSGRFEIKEVAHEGLPRYARELEKAVESGDEYEIERHFVRFLTLYCSFVEGVLSMPSYEIVVDTCKHWDKFPTLRRGFASILSDEGRHITFGTGAIRILLEKRPEFTAEVHSTINEFEGSLIGLVEYQRTMSHLDLEKYQTQKVRHYRNRCREMGVDPDEGLIENILDPELDFVVGVVAG